MRRALWTYTLLAAANFTNACSSSKPASNDIAQPASADDAAAPADGALVGTVTCMADPRVDAYKANLEKRGTQGVYTFRLTSSDPAPPAKGTDTFVLRILDANGMPVEGALDVDLYMPDHGHPSPVKPQVTYDVQAGAYTATPVYLFMAGVWRATFRAYLGAPDAGPPADSAVFYFCIEG